jgi:hypothetical protein
MLVVYMCTYDGDNIKVENNKMAFQSFDIDHSWERLMQERFVRIKLDIYFRFTFLTHDIKNIYFCFTFLTHDIKNIYFRFTFFPMTLKIIIVKIQWLLYNANSAICHLYYGENKLIFNEMMMRSVLF